jgi:luciferase family oxidoreductase group 1
VGESLKKETIDLLILIYRVNTRQDKGAVLQEAKERIEVIRLLIRLMKDLHQISIKNFVAINTIVEEVSKQLTASALRRDLNAAMDFSGNVQELQQYLSASSANKKVRAFPGEGLDIPIWILGSSTDSAYLAASLGLPYAFASHFAPAQLFEATAIYRKNFKPSVQLETPYVMPCINVIAAATDAKAAHLATSFKRLFLGIITGNRQKLSPPEVFEIDPMEEAALQQMIRFTFTGGPDKIGMELQPFIEVTGADELMITSPIYDHELLMESYRIVNAIRTW